MPKISVIMGVYNCKNYDMLKKSVDSVLNQSFSDFEFLICNDGSSDDTLSMLNRIKLLDKRIKILSYKNNRGLSYALNYCLKSASGEYIARQDDDDISYYDRFEKQVSFLDSNHKYAFVGSNADVYDSNGIWGEYLLDEKPDKKSFFWSSPFIHPAVMFRRKSLLEVDGYRWAKETRRCEDYDLFMRMYASGMAGYNIGEKLYKYRIENDAQKKYRPMKYRIDEAIVRFKGYSAMGVLFRGIPYIIKPIIIGLIPQKIFYRVKKNQY